MWKQAIRPGKWKLCQLFWAVKPGNRVWEKKNTRSDPLKEENRVWECENKQLDPGIEIMSTILGSQAQKPGLGKEKYAPRPARGRKPGLEREKYVPRPGDWNYVNHFEQSSPETGSGERKIRAQTRSRKKTGSGEKKIYSQTREVRDLSDFHPLQPYPPPLAFRYPT